MKGCIYKITSPNGKIYIGQSKNFNKRMQTYKRAVYQGQPKIENSLRKYGFENHKVDIIFKQDEYNVDVLNTMETQFIYFFNSVEDGLNCNYGGDNLSWTEERKDKMRGKNNYMFGKTHTEKSKKLISIKSSISLIGNDYGCVSIVNTESGKEYKSIKEAALDYGIKYNTFRAYLTDKRYPNKIPFKYKYETCLQCDERIEYCECDE